MVHMELSLHLSLDRVPKPMSQFLNQVSEIPYGAKRSSMVDDYVNRLRAELKKLAAFKRELPLCMLLLNDAIERLEDEAIKCKENWDRFEAQEIVPLMMTNSEDCEEKKKWMSSVQLWSADNDLGDKKQGFGPQPNLVNDKRKQLSPITEEEPIQLCKSRNRGGAFVPFKAQPENKSETDMSSLSLMTPVSSLNSDDPNQPNIQRRQQHSPRKQRRCWSPELHRRFVAALQQLGGSHAATPKQIRELMQVDGLTNDEVKSHLQAKIQTSYLKASESFGPASK